MNILTARAAGDFSGLASAYVQGRRGYPEWVFHMLKEKMAQDRGYILDAGCGTGESTRDLALHFPHFLITGVDRELTMLGEAMRHHSSPRITYEHKDLSVAHLGHLPGSFAAVTAFSAFHWFAGESFTVGGLVDLLFPDGLFFAANKYVKEEIIPEWPEAFLKKWAPGPLKRGKDGYNPVGTLEAFGFSIQRVSRPEREMYSPEQAYHLIQSSSLWNTIPEDKKSLAAMDLRELINRRTEGGVLERMVDVVAVLGHSRVQ